MTCCAVVVPCANQGMVTELPGVTSRAPSSWDVQRIAELYRIETEIRGEDADERQAVRHQKSKPLIEALKRWLETTLR